MNIFRIRNRWGVGALACVFAVCVAPACKKSNNTGSAGTVLDSTYFGRLPFVVHDNYTYSLYYAALKATGYTDTLGQSAGPFTILVPNNDAMQKSGYVYNNNSGVNYFLQVVDPTLSQYVRYYILPGAHYLRSLPLGANQQITTLLGTPVYVTRYLSGTDTLTTINGSLVVASDLPATNGLVDVLSSVPEPQTTTSIWQRMEKDPTLAFFVTAIQRAGLQSLFEAPDSAFTVLAPSNIAFSQIYTAINHTISMVSPDSILAADPAQLRLIVLEHVLRGIRFTSDFVQQAGLFVSDSLRLTMYNDSTVIFTNANNNPGFVSNALTESYGQYFDPVTQTYKYGFYGNPYLNVASYYITFFTDQAAVVYQDRPTGNGVLQVISAVMLP
jgi:uncharacterized surface protein with fasciclin (FAS1) repeats